jgi:N-methylhydantoinase B
VLHRHEGAYTSAHWSKDQDLHLVADDTIEVRTPGGGGYGDPLTRAPELVRRDVARGYYTADDALRHYGVVLRGDPPTIDDDATVRLRAERTR